MTLQHSHGYPPLFFRLPGELRNQIYTYIFTPVTISLVRKKGLNGKPQKSGLELRRHSTKPWGMSLLLVCRQMHGETALLPYDVNSFHFSSHATFAEMLCEFSVEQRTAMKNVHMEIKGTEEVGLAGFMDRMDHAGIRFAALLPNVRRMKLETYSRFLSWLDTEKRFVDWVNADGGVMVKAPSHDMFGRFIGA